MVKGTTRRVIVVKSPDPKIFEEAIFIIREDIFSGGVSAAQLMREAQRVAAGYTRSRKGFRRLLTRLPAPAIAAAGAAATGLAWLALHLIA